MERMGISAWSTGPRQEAEPSVSIKRRTLSFSISMYLEMTRIMSFFDQPYEFRRTACLICHRRSFSRNLAVSLERLVFRCFRPPSPAFQHPGQPYKESLWPRRRIRWGYSALRACGIRSGKPVRRRTLFLPRVLPDWWNYDVFIIRNSAKDIHG